MSSYLDTKLLVQLPIKILIKLLMQVLFGILIKIPTKILREVLIKLRIQSLSFWLLIMVWFPQIQDFVVFAVIYKGLVL